MLPVFCRGTVKATKEVTAESFVELWFAGFPVLVRVIDYIFY